VFCVAFVVHFASCVGTEVFAMTARAAIAFLAVLAAWGTAAAQTIGQTTDVTPRGQILPKFKTTQVGEVPKDPQAEIQLVRSRCQEEIAAAEKALGEQKWFAAWDALHRASTLAIDPAHALRIRALLQQLEAEGRKLLEKADAAYEAGKFADAIAQYTSVSRLFGGLPCASDARGSLKKAESDPLAQKALQELKATEQDTLVQRVLAKYFGGPSASTRPAAATRPTAMAQPADRVGQIRQIPAQDAIAVIDTLQRIVNLYPLSPTADRARQDLQSLQADNDFQASLQRARDSQQARSLYQRARAFLSAGMADKALEDCREIIRRFPNSPEAAQAKAILGDRPPTGK
jgi:tetratricopeptide (TPR) repeat protein